MGTKRRQHNPGFKAKVAIEAIKDEETSAQLASRYGVHPAMIRTWKRTLQEGAVGIFGVGKKIDKDQEQLISELYSKIGKLTVEKDFLARKLDP